MSKKKFYAVKKGRKVGIYTIWDVCSKMVTGYSGAVYKSFDTWKEAEVYLQSGESTDTQQEPSEVAAYVDGSFDETVGACYGVVIFHNGNEYHFSNASPDIAMRNVSGEIKGAKCAMQYCLDNNAKSLDLYYDYEGIEKWCSGDWRANKTETKEYKAFYDSIADKLRINFYKVEAHSGDLYNELADRLAKMALYQ